MLKNKTQIKNLGLVAILGLFSGTASAASIYDTFGNDFADTSAFDVEEWGASRFTVEQLDCPNGCDVTEASLQLFDGNVFFGDTASLDGITLSVYSDGTDENGVKLGSKLFSFNNPAEIGAGLTTLSFSVSNAENSFISNDTFYWLTLENSNRSDSLAWSYSNTGSSSDYSMVQQGAYAGNFESLPFLFSLKASSRDSTTPGTEQLREEYVTRLYNILLNRDPDSTGLSYWKDKIENESASTIFFGFINSNEYQASLANKTNTEYLDDLYSSLFDREGDTGGFNYWLDQLEIPAINGLPELNRDLVAYQFIFSDEFRDLANSFGLKRITRDDVYQHSLTELIYHTYASTLSRAPSHDEIVYWSNVPLTIQSEGLLENKLIQFGAGVFNSNEFRNRNLSTAETLILLYQSFLQRTPSEGEIAYWVDRVNLGNGSAEDDILNFLDTIIYSQESKTLIFRYMPLI